MRQIDDTFVVEQAGKGRPFRAKGVGKRTLLRPALAIAGAVAHAVAHVRPLVSTGERSASCPPHRPPSALAAVNEGDSSDKLSQPHVPMTDFVPTPWGYALITL